MHAAKPGRRQALFELVPDPEAREDAGPEMALDHVARAVGALVVDDQNTPLSGRGMLRRKAFQHPVEDGRVVIGADHDVEFILAVCGRRGVGSQGRVPSAVDPGESRRLGTTLLILFIKSDGGFMTAAGST